MHQVESVLCRVLFGRGQRHFFGSNVYCMGTPGSASTSQPCQREGENPPHYLGLRWRIIGQWVDVGGGVGTGRVYAGSTSRAFIPAVAHATAIGTRYRRMHRSARMALAWLEFGDTH